MEIKKKSIFRFKLGVQRFIIAPVVIDILTETAERW